MNDNKPIGKRRFRNNKTGEIVSLVEIKKELYIDICVYTNKSTGEVGRAEKGYFFLTHTEVEWS